MPKAKFKSNNTDPSLKMKKENLRQEMSAIEDAIADQARKPSEFPDAKYEYEAIRFVMKNIDKLYE